jgi:hypothetical protein
MCCLGDKQAKKTVSCPLSLLLCSFSESSSAIYLFLPLSGWQWWAFLFLGWEWWVPNQLRRLRACCLLPARHSLAFFETLRLCGPLLPPRPSLRRCSSSSQASFSFIFGTLFAPSLLLTLSLLPNDSLIICQHSLPLLFARECCAYPSLLSDKATFSSLCPRLSH